MTARLFDLPLLPDLFHTARACTLTSYIPLFHGWDPRPMYTIVQPGSRGDDGAMWVRERFWTTEVERESRSHTTRLVDILS